MNRNWGLRFDGLGEDIEKIIINYLSNSNNKRFIYAEIGAGTCLTMRAIYDIVKENIKHNDWSIWGLDIENGYSLDWDKINTAFSQEELQLYVNRQRKNVSYGHAQLYIEKEPRKWIENIDNNSLNIALIDADHSYREVTKDFLAIENKVIRGGLIGFHDTCVLSQGTDYQSFGDDFINHIT